MIWLTVLSSLEAGMWLGWLSTKIGSRAKVRESLINGTRAAKTIGVVDRQLEQQTRAASSLQRKAAAGVARAIRAMAQTRAFELVVLKIIQQKSPGARNEQEVEVKLHL